MNNVSDSGFDSRNYPVSQLCRDNEGASVNYLNTARPEGYVHLHSYSGVQLPSSLYQNNQVMPNITKNSQYSSLPMKNESIMPNGNLFCNNHSSQQNTLMSMQSPSFLQGTKYMFKNADSEFTVGDKVSGEMERQNLNVQASESIICTTKNATGTINSVPIKSAGIGESSIDILHGHECRLISNVSVITSDLCCKYANTADSVQSTSFNIPHNDVIQSVPSNIPYHVTHSTSSNTLLNANQSTSLNVQHNVISSMSSNIQCNADQAASSSISATAVVKAVTPVKGRGRGRGRGFAAEIALSTEKSHILANISPESKRAIEKIIANQQNVNFVSPQIVLPTSCALQSCVTNTEQLGSSNEKQFCAEEYQQEPFSTTRNDSSIVMHEGVAEMNDVLSVAEKHLSQLHLNSSDSIAMTLSKQAPKLVNELQQCRSNIEALELPKDQYDSIECRSNLLFNEAKNEGNKIHTKILNSSILSVSKDSDVFSSSLNDLALESQCANSRADSFDAEFKSENECALFAKDTSMYACDTGAGNKFNCALINSVLPETSSSEDSALSNDSKSQIVTLYKQPSVIMDINDNSCGTDESRQKNNEFIPVKSVEQLVLSEAEIFSGTNQQMREISRRNKRPLPPLTDLIPLKLDKNQFYVSKMYIRDDVCTLVGE